MTAYVVLLDLIACSAVLVSTSDQTDTVAFLALSAALPWQAPAFPMSCQRLCRGMHSPRRQSVMQSGSDGTNTLGCLAVQLILKLRLFVSKRFDNITFVSTWSNAQFILAVVNCRFAAGLMLNA